MRAAYESRAAVVAQLDGRNGLRCHMPEGGMFIMLDVRACGIPAGEFAERLLAEEDVSVLPTEGFGPSGHGHVRISLATERGAPRRGLRAHRALRGRAAGARRAHLRRALARRTPAVSRVGRTFRAGP